MVLIYHDFYLRKYRILGRFLFSCTNFDDPNLTSQSFKTDRLVVSTEYSAILSISESLNQKVTGIKKI